MSMLHTILGPLALACALAGCGRTGNDIAFQHIRVLDAGHIAVHAHDGPDAIVAADGGLSIAGQPVPTTPAQRILLKQYFSAAVALRDDALATGLAGAATAGQAIGSVVAGLASGDTAKIGPEIEARAARVEAKAAKICSDLAEIRVRQDAIAAELAAFRPYALLTREQVAQCGRA